MKYTKLAAVALASVMMLSACGQSANSDNPDCYDCRRYTDYRE